MQSAKDSFYVALRERLAALNPQRTVFLNGETRPAVIVVENEHITAAGPLPEAFYLRWGNAKAAMPGDPPLMALDCTISYWTGGSAESQGVDRGRVLAQLDGELLAICSPGATPKCDHSQTPAADLGTVVMWNAPELRMKTQAQLRGESPGLLVPGDELIAAPGQSAPVIRLEREAMLTILFHAEASLG